MPLKISQMTEADPLTGNELVEITVLSAVVTKTATTISALASDNSYNDSGAGWISAGFAVGDQVKVTGFTGNVANNVVSAAITVLTAGKMTIGGTDGDVLVDDAAGESVTITKWLTRRTTVDEIAALAATGSASTTQTDEMISGYFGAPTAKNYKIVVKAAHGGTITETTTISESGTGTITFKINTTALGGTANAASSSEQSQSHSSANVFAAGDDIVITPSSLSSLIGLSFTIKYTRTYA